jgi:hypothetical protein
MSVIFIRLCVSQLKLMGNMRRKRPIERGGPTVYLSSKNLILCSAKSQMTKEFASTESGEVCLIKWELLRLIQIHSWRHFCSYHKRTFPVRVLIYFAIKYFSSEVDSSR